MRPRPPSPPNLLPQQALRNRKVVFWTIVGLAAATIAVLANQPPKSTPSKRAETPIERCQTYLSTMDAITGARALPDSQDTILGRYHWCETHADQFQEQSPSARHIK
jgi:hypothetical protein